MTQYKNELKRLIEELEKKGERLEALIKLGDSLKDEEGRLPISFNGFLNIATRRPRHVFRNVFQLFYDTVQFHVPKIDIKKAKKKEPLGFVNYDCSNLFEKDCDDPFFADRLFTNRFMKLVDDIKQATQNNRIFLFEGPPGSGKSTFLNILLKKFEDYTLYSRGNLYETHWRLDIERLGGFRRFERELHKLAKETGDSDLVDDLISTEMKDEKLPKKYLEFACPNHDHPILQIPKSYRRQFLNELITDKKFKKELFNKKEYEWVFKDSACSICNSVYDVLTDIVNEPIEVLNMINARKVKFSRQFGDGISVFNPGDPIIKEPLKRPRLQNKLNDLLKKEEIPFIYSFLAKTNNGILALMDIKENNIKRLMNLHGIISDGVHKVGYIEERIKTLFVGLINPADKKHYENVPSFKDRIITVSIPYVLDYKTEMFIYKNKFGNSSEDKFLPNVLENVAKIIIASRLKNDSKAIKKWLKDTKKYDKYADKNFLLLKLELYSGNIPDWLSEEDKKNLTETTKKEILEESTHEGQSGISGRESIYLFNSFVKKYFQKKKKIRMDNVSAFYGQNQELKKHLSNDFIDSLVQQYDYELIQMLREAIYYFNEKQIRRDIINYMYCVNFEIGTTVKSIYTGDIIELDENYFKNFEAIFMGTTSTAKMRQSFRKEVQAEYVSNTLSVEMQVKKRKIQNTKQFNSLYEKYANNLKENAFRPYEDNENFRLAINDYNTEAFRTYDNKIKRDVKHFLENLIKRHKYTLKGAKEIVLYAMDKKLSGKF